MDIAIAAGRGGVERCPGDRGRAERNAILPLIT
jgi:hypothetical protein